MRGYRGIYPEYSQPHGRTTLGPPVLAVTGLTPPDIPRRTPGPDRPAGTVTARSACNQRAASHVLLAASQRPASAPRAGNTGGGGPAGRGVLRSNWVAPCGQRITSVAYLAMVRPMS